MILTTTSPPEKFTPPFTRGDWYAFSDAADEDVPPHIDTFIGILDPVEKVEEKRKHKLLSGDVVGRTLTGKRPSTFDPGTVCQDTAEEARDQLTRQLSSFYTLQNGIVSGHALRPNWQWVSGRLEDDDEPLFYVTVTSETVSFPAKQSAYQYIRSQFPEYEETTSKALTKTFSAPLEGGMVNWPCIRVKAAAGETLLEEQPVLNGVVNDVIDYARRHVQDDTELVHYGTVEDHVYSLSLFFEEYRHPAYNDGERVPIGGEYKESQDETTWLLFSREEEILADELNPVDIAVNHGEILEAAMRDDPVFSGVDGYRFSECTDFWTYETKPVEPGEDTEGYTVLADDETLAASLYFRDSDFSDPAISFRVGVGITPHHHINRFSHYLDLAEVMVATTVNEEYATDRIAEEENAFLHDLCRYGGEEAEQFLEETVPDRYRALRREHLKNGVATDT